MTTDQQQPADEEPVHPEATDDVGPQQGEAPPEDQDPARNPDDQGLKDIKGG